jgi:DNA polymerase (family 10)
VAGDDERDIYRALELDWVPPELREDRGEIDAAIAHRLPHLVDLPDLRGDLHMHTTATDGRDDIDAMARAAHARGHEYIAITDHSHALAMANGLDDTRALAHAAQVRARNGRYDTLTLLAGIECDILADGTLDLSDDCLAQLDIVIASVHSHFSQSPEQMTERLLRAIEHPRVDVIGHPTGRLLLAREAYGFDLERVVAAAVRHGVAFEINSQTNRLDLSDVHARFAVRAGARVVISTDAHSTAALGNLPWGVRTARRAWLQPDDVLNTRPLTDLRRLLRRNRSAA